MNRFSGVTIAVIAALVVGFGAGYWAHGHTSRTSNLAGAPATAPNFENSAYVGGILKSTASDSLRLESIPGKDIKITSQTKFWQGSPDSTLEFSNLKPGDNLMIMLKEPFGSRREAIAVSVEVQGHISEAGPVTDGAAVEPEGDPSKDPANTEPPVFATPPPAPKLPPPK